MSEEKRYQDLRDAVSRAEQRELAAAAEADELREKLEDARDGIEYLHDKLETAREALEAVSHLITTRSVTMERTYLGFLTTGQDEVARKVKAALAEIENNGPK